MAAREKLSGVELRNRQLRQESLRDLLSKGKHVEQVVKNVKDIEDLKDALDTEQVNRLKIATDIRLKLINKYLPDLKNIEVAGDGGGDLVIKVTSYKTND